MDVDLGQPVTAVERWFFTPLHDPRGPLQVIGWWERRRPLFNVGVGLAGLLTLGIGFALGVLPTPGTMPGEVVGVILYALLANACYSLGPVVDLALRWMLGIRAPGIAPVLFRYGFVFSIGLTLLPIPLMVLGTMARIVAGAEPAS